ncbi:hypothetical protein V5O48_010299 [Marasmius crinis-equi]|uniref:DUF4604 domain-containing protein n=1 Tax=Marasmius crinis-equi TaxID=585013 RepID=A0ABR3F8S0_9AGAR
MSRKDKEPTRAQLSSKLAYQQHVPSFLQKFQNKMAGVPDEPEDYDDEWEYDGSGRPPIPRRPAIPERPASQPGSEDEDDGDEKPQVVVLREGKHLTEREAENVRRKEKGLPPLPDMKEESSEDKESEPSSKKDAKGKTKAPAPSLSFSSAKSTSNKSFKRKVLGGDSDDDKDSDKKGKPAGKDKKEPPKKKSKKSTKTLLSFGDDA